MKSTNVLKESPSRIVLKVLFTLIRESAMSGPKKSKILKTMQPFADKVRIAEKEK